MRKNGENRNDDERLFPPDLAPFLQSFCWNRTFFWGLVCNVSLHWLKVDAKAPSTETNQVFSHRATFTLCLTINLSGGFCGLGRIEIKDDHRALDMMEAELDCNHNGLETIIFESSITTRPEKSQKIYQHREKPKITKIFQFAKKFQTYKAS